MVVKLYNAIPTGAPDRGSPLFQAGYDLCVGF